MSLGLWEPRRGGAAEACVQTQALAAKFKGKCRVVSWSWAIQRHRSHVS